LELNKESISIAVALYIQHQVGQLAELKKYNARTRDTIQYYLASNASDTFLWVALVYQNLENVPHRKVLSMLKVFPPGLNSLYRRMIEQIYRL
jgi:hypothetical protein